MEYFRHKKEYLPEIRKAYDNLAEQKSFFTCGVR